jgi:Asp-tRNA(Asn)/Glu-tRNA(Gln) amidotransferase A subunit family amidase
VTEAWQIAETIRTGKTTAVDAVSESLERIAAVDDGIGAFTLVTEQSALARAAEVDRGEHRGPLAGVPISVKDHIWAHGLPATNGSRALVEFIAPADCVCVARLAEAGAVIVGKTNNPEFCYRGITDNELYGPTRNPADPSRTTGGSSGGAAASVAGGMVPLALGTDGGGSIRIPSAFCGTYGIKPSFGLVPKLPGFRGWPTLSVTGPIAASVRDLGLALSIMAGPSRLDPLSYPAPPADYLAAVESPSLDGLRIAMSVDLGFAELDPEVRTCFLTALDTISDAGAQLSPAHPQPIDPTGLWDSIALPEGYASEGPVVEANPDLVGSDATAIVMAGAEFSARQYLDSQHARSAYSERWENFFDDYDVLLTPMMPVTAFEIGRLAPATIDGRPVPESFDAWCALALPANLAGLPAVSVPIGSGRDGLPVGMQVMGRRWADAVVLRAAAAIAQL